MFGSTRFNWRPGVLFVVLASAAMLCLSAATIEAAVRNVAVIPVSDAGLYGDLPSGQERSNRGTGGRWDIGPVQTGLLKFDVQSQLASDEMVIDATLQLYTARQGYVFDMHVVAYPLAAAWQEGIGNAGAVGDLGFPWGPASIGDAVWLYKQTTQVGLGTSSFAAVQVATDGVAWNTAGARGVGSDVLNRLMIDQDWAKVNAQAAVGTPLEPLALTADGVAVLRGWSSGTVANNGMSIWPSSSNGYSASTSREYAAADARPQLLLTISLKGDVDGDGHVGSADLLLLVPTWGLSVGAAGYNPACDIDGDGAVNVVDLLKLATNWGR